VNSCAQRLLDALGTVLPYAVLGRWDLTIGLIEDRRSERMMAAADRKRSGRDRRWIRLRATVLTQEWRDQASIDISGKVAGGFHAGP
jgi:hypothetical protein